MQNLPVQSDPNLIVGAERSADAGVYLLADGLAMVQSVDFFAPVVDDPYVFGQIAAANALSDLYACGAVPKTALNIVCFPDNELDLSVLSDILAGAAERVNKAGAVVVGGHSIRDTEVKCGLAVTGVVDPAKMLTNQQARVGDAIVLTKAIGTGFITTALRADRCPDDVLASACESMTTLNAAGGAGALACGASAATDVTGFGLAVHARELADASDVTIEIELGRVPILKGAEDLAAEEFFTGANRANREHLADRLELQVDSTSRLVEFLFDPQTSGGLLIATPPSEVDRLIELCQAGDLTEATRIGAVTTRKNASVVVTD